MNRGGVRPAGPADGGYPAKFAPRSPAKACTLLLPVWGAAFVRKFLDFCLPTLLAPGNVPALAQALPTRFVLLTRSSDVPRVLEHPRWRQLAQLCSTDIRPIDDLIVDGNHHASITLAYVRALHAAGVAMRDTVFLFLVGDYLVADGSLRSVLERIQAGASGVLAGSLQIADGTAIPLLHDRQQASARDIALPPRLLASWALAHLDPRNAVVNGCSLYDVDANKLFWSVNKDTLIGRFYLLHMIGIRPEVTDFVVGAPCDYAFIPELCPSNRVDVLTDSDDYLVVEMQRRGAGSLRPGPVHPSQLARSLSQWTTARHRQNAGATLVFHARDVPENIAETCAAASGFIAEVANALDPAPQPHRGHPSWIGMMALQRAGAGLPDDCRPVLDAASLRGGLTSLLWRLRLRMLGHPPRVTACHPRWPDFHAAYAALRQHLSRGDRLLVLSASAPAFARWLEPLCDDIAASEWEFIARISDGASTQSFDACLWVVEHEQLGNGGAIIERIAQILKPGGPLLIFAAQDLDGELLDLGSTCTSLDRHLRQSAICADEAHYVPAGWLRLALHRALASTMRANRQRRRVMLPVLLGAGALIISAIFIGNRLFWNRRSFAPSCKDCSSILLAGHRPAKAADPAIDCQNGRGYDGLMQHPLVPAKAGTQITNPEQPARDSSSRGNERAGCVDPTDTRSRIVEAIGAGRWARRRG